MRKRLTTLLLVAAVGLSACSSGSGHPDDKAQDTRERSSGCNPDSGTEMPEGPRTLTIDGDERTYLLALPDDYEGDEAVPLLFSFHDSAGRKESHESSTLMAEKGAARGFVVVTPEALGDPSEWNIAGDQARADDFGFINALLEDLSAELCIDLTRVYAAGHGTGSAFAGFVVCQRPDPFAALGMVATFLPAACATTSQAPAVIAFHGTADPVVHYEGGLIAGGPVGVPPVLDTLDHYADRYGCEQPATEDEPTPGLQRHSLSGCEHDSDVVLYTIVDGGHDWPGAGDAQDAATAPPLQASDVILDFFDDH